MRTGAEVVGRAPVLAGLVLLIAWGAGGAAAQAAPWARPIEVRVNGMLLGAGVAFDGPWGTIPEVLLNVEDLRRSVEGPAAAEPRWLEVQGRSLRATRTGSCDGCMLRVRRTVSLSESLRPVGGAAHIPLRDLVRALEGRLEIDGEAGLYSIYVGRCSWCVLEPGRSR